MSAAAEETSGEEYEPQWRVCPLHPQTNYCYSNQSCRTDEARHNTYERRRRTKSRDPVKWAKQQRENSRKWHRENRERSIEQQRVYYRADPQRAYEYAQRWREANPVAAARVRRAIQNRRRARRRENGVEPYSLAELWAQAEPIAWCCYLCGDEITGDWVVEHVLAISRGGADRLSNVMPAHDECNGRKGKKYLADLTWTDHGAVMARLSACGIDLEPSGASE